MRKVQLLCIILLGLLACGLTSGGAATQRGRKPRPAAVCGDPTVRCRSSVGFEPYQLPFVVPADGVIWETEKFYAVILKSVRNENNQNGDCVTFVPETERVEAQALFPRHKVFTSRCFETGDLYYTGVADGSQFMAVYAGRTRAEAAAMLAKVRAMGRFPGANLRRMTTGFNGT